MFNQQVQTYQEKILEFDKPTTFTDINETVHKINIFF